MNSKGCNIASPSVIILFSVSLIGVLVFTKEITSIAKINPNLGIVSEQYHETVFESDSHESEVTAEAQFQGQTGEGKDDAEEEDDDEAEIKLPQKDCDLSKGRWVFDKVNRPLYREEECQFLTAQVTCIENGRKDTLYQKWSWQPNDCSLPKFNAKLLLEKLRGKRLMFVGDSVNRNQWESMVCLLNSAVSPGKATWKMGAPLSVFSIQEYNTTVEFYWAPFLVESNADDPRNHSISQRIITPDSISMHGKHWKPADYLVFNTYIWWMNNPTIKVQRGSSFEEVERPAAYERVLTTWADWLKHNINHNRTSSFFISMSPVHQESSNWNRPDGIACALETAPITNASMLVDIGTDKRLLEIARNVINGMGIPVSLIDITTLSEYRKDGHTSVYTIRQGKLLTPEQKADPATYADCLHWCLPGVPDTWNELLYAHIISTSTP